MTLRELLESTDWEEAKTRSKIPLALGKDVYGKTIIADLAQMPHLLVAGTTGSGKSVCINAHHREHALPFTPEELRFIMIDPKVVEMQIYNTSAASAFPVVTDPKKVLLALRWVIDEMEKRYKIFAKRRRAQHHQLQRAAEEEDAKRTGRGRCRGGRVAREIVQCGRHGRLYNYQSPARR